MSRNCHRQFLIAGAAIGVAAVSYFGVQHFRRLRNANVTTNGSVNAKVAPKPDKGSNPSTSDDPYESKEAKVEEKESFRINVSKAVVFCDRGAGTKETYETADVAFASHQGH